MPRCSRTAAPDGFTLVELVLAGTLMAAVLSGAAAALLVANRSSGRQGGLSRIDSLIDQDLAAIQALDRRFTCCTGSPCTATASAISASASCRNAAGTAVNPGNENYYSPRQSIPTTSAETTAWDNFRTACRSGTIASTFQALLPAAPTAEAPAGLTRTVARPDPNPTNLLRISYAGTYAGSAVSTRVVSLIPTAANWCP